MNRKKRLVRTVPASQVKNNFGQILKRVYENEETQIIERAGLPVAAIVPISDLERLYPEEVNTSPQVAASVKRHRAMQRLTAVLDEMQQGSERFSEEEVEVDVQKAIAEVRRARNKK